MIERQEWCGTCRWFELDPPSMQEEGSENVGQCHRFPKVLSLGERDRRTWREETKDCPGEPMRADHSFINWVHPHVLETDFCGEWKAP